MDEQAFWERFTEDGRIENYLKYRKNATEAARMEFDNSDKNNSSGIGDKGTERR